MYLGDSYGKYLNKKKRKALMKARLKLLRLTFIMFMLLLAASVAVLWISFVYLRLDAPASRGVVSATAQASQRPILIRPEPVEDIVDEGICVSTLINDTTEIENQLIEYDEREECYDERTEDFSGMVEEMKRSIGYFEVTAYCLCVICTETYSHEYEGNDETFVQKTASGTIPLAGRTVATDTDVIPFGTSIYVTGAGWRIAEDRGGAIRGNRIDVLKQTHQEALEWGRRRNVEVFIWR